VVYFGAAHFQTDPLQPWWTALTGNRAVLDGILFLLATIVSPFFRKPFGTSQSPKGVKSWRRVIAFGGPRSIGPDPTRGSGPGSTMT